MSGKFKPIVSVVIVLVIAAGILTLVFSRCDSTPPAVTEDFDYFKAKAYELDNDPTKIISFVKNDVSLLPHRGNVKGPLGALWDGAGSADEKLALAERLLEAIPGQKESVEVTLEEVAPERDKKRGETGGKSFKLTITHRLVMPGDAEPKDTEIYSGHIGALVGGVHSITVEKPGTTVINLRGEANIDKKVSAIGGIGEEIFFLVERPGKQEPELLVRELWRIDNKRGPLLPIKGDRHDFLVLPCKVSKYVMEKEKGLLKIAEPDNEELNKHYAALLKYCFQSDNATIELEDQYECMAAFDTPRIIILSKYNIPPSAGGPAYALDLRLNRAGFYGEKKAGPYMAETARSFYEAGMEHAFLEEWTGKSVTSPFNVFSCIALDLPSDPAARVGIIEAAINEFKASAASNGRLKFGAYPSRKDPSPLAEVSVERAGGKLKISGKKPSDELAASLEETGQKLPPLGDGFVLETDDMTRAILAVENGLLAAEGKNVPPDYLVKVEMEPGTRPIFTPGTIYKMKGNTQSLFWFKQTKGDLVFDFKIWNDSQTIPGTLTITEKARKEATDYHTWWYDEHRTYKDKVSLIVTGPMYEALSKGKTATYTRNGKLDEPQTVDFKEKLKHKVKINGKEIEIPVIAVTRNGNEYLIYDNKDLPIFGVNLTEYILTPIRCRLVDENGFGIWNAEVEIEGRNIEVKTGPDGSFRLPAPPPGESYGKTMFVVSKNDRLIGCAESDLSAPGLETVTITVPRVPTPESLSEEKADDARKKILWLTPKDLSMAESLEIYDQAKRHLVRLLESGRHVAVPARMVSCGGSMRTAFFAFDPKTGYFDAVAETGLHQSTENTDSGYQQFLETLHDKWGQLNQDAGDLESEIIKNSVDKIANELGLSEEGAAACSAATDLLLETEMKVGMIETLHAYRGSLAAYYGYSRHRIGQKDKTDHRLAYKNTLAEMEAWAEACDMFSGIDDPTGGFLGDAVEGMVNKATGGISGGSAKAAFKLGYLAALRGIEKTFGGQE